MSIKLSDFWSQLRTLAELQGSILTEDEPSHMAECYPRCRGKGHWDVREYVRPAKVGTREYRVVRGSGVQEVYRSAERARAAAVRTALNELESRQHPEGAA
jgi:hypothetical protein